MDFAPPIVPVNKEGWGPVPGAGLAAAGVAIDYTIESLEKYPIKKIAHICDFSLAALRFQEQRLAKGKGKAKGKSKGPVVLQPGKDEDGFALVAEKEKNSKGGGRGKGGFGRGKGRGKAMAVNYQEGILGQKQKPFSTYQNLAKGKGKGKGKAKGKGLFRTGRGIPSFKEWSVQTKAEWAVMMELPLSTLSKLQIDSKDIKFEDVKWCGNLRDYQKNCDRISIRTEKPLQRFEDLDFFNVTSQDDPILQEACQQDDINVIATDQVLAVLIAAARSSYSWDLVVTKLGNKILIDKRNYAASIDYLTVNETAPEPPNNENPDEINGPIKLGQEASCINQNFTQMVLDYSKDKEDMPEPNPFVDEDNEGEAASVAYRYRTVVIPGNSKDEAESNRRPIKIMMRTEVNARNPDGPGKYISVKALNEYLPTVTYSWRKQLETQRGNVLATELKNNSFKLGRWTAEAILSGCDTMKIGYITRQRVGDVSVHSVLGVQTYQTDSFAEQIGMTRNNAFGILRSIVDLVMGFDEGKYLILKDPTKSVIRIYDVPWEAFADEDDDEDEEDDDDDGVELDEDGNVAPVRASVPGPMPTKM